MGAIRLYQYQPDCEAFTERKILPQRQAFVITRLKYPANYMLTPPEFVHAIREVL